MAAVLVPISRMYIGVHTPLDVFVSIAVALLLIAILTPIILENTQKSLPIVLAVMVLCGISFLCYVEYYPFPAVHLLRLLLLPSSTDNPSSVP